MAIKIIKEGKKEYYMTCSQCGCQFTYELEDIGYGSSIDCPCCGKSLYHNGYFITVSNPLKDSTLPIITIDTVDNKNPCENCDWYKKIKTGATYVGDTPCTWCPHGVQVINGSEVATISTSVTKLD